eukprot:5145315-Amphidinium_carterae.1
MLHSQTTVSWTYEPLPGCPATHLDAIRANRFAASGEQEPRSSTGCTREALCAIRWKRQRSRNETYINVKPSEKGLVSQPKVILVCSWYVACVTTLRQSCPGAWILPLDIS